ncbi:RHS repeat domain-containing protein [Streptomyces sp. XD-27]|uniref:RHS repeat domain-containing protein n=1 Tax=Streptomyces sp. XD-27 TaxID=3062779 RepID=UPI00350E3582
MDAEDRLHQVTTPDGTQWRYLCDPFGRRVAKQRLNTDDEVTERRGGADRAVVQAGQDRRVEAVDRPYPSSRLDRA